jgi:Outer membrane protein beta-barrel domain
MRPFPGRTVTASVSLLMWILPLHAQNSESEPFSNLNSNVGFTISVPSGATAKYMSIAWGFNYGAGYNFNTHHSLIGEVMWNKLYATNGALGPIRAALQNNDIKGRGNLVALIANYRLQFEGQTFGSYFIAGGGLYYRNSRLSQSVTIGNSVTCTPAWLWWGFMCASGAVVSDQTLASSSSTAPGGSAGIGFTVRLADSHYKLYVESRYHYAAHKFIATQIMPITIGIRF